MEELERRVARIRTSISKGRDDLVADNRLKIVETAPDVTEENTSC